MLFNHLLVVSSLAGALAAPTSHHLNLRGARSSLTVVNLSPASINIRNAHINKRSQTAALAPVATAEAAAAAADANACAASAAGQAAAAEGVAEEGAAEEEVLIDAAFGEQVTLGGGDTKQDVLYAPTVSPVTTLFHPQTQGHANTTTLQSAGAFEVEFQAAEGSTLAVTENKTPAAPPAGFIAVEASSFIVQLPGGSSALTLQKIDYFFDVASKHPTINSPHEHMLIVQPSQTQQSLLLTWLPQRSANSLLMAAPLPSSRASWSSKQRRMS